MTANATWTPASRPGIIPLHPLTFGTILGRAFAALRHNPRVLLGFALCVQVVVYLAMLAAIGAVGWAAFSRLERVTASGDDYNAVLAGSIGLVAVTTFVLGLVAGAVGVVVQAVVVNEVAHAVVAEKLTLRALWGRVRPVAWRLIGYAFLLSAVMLAVIAIVAGILFAVGTAVLPVAIGLGVLALLAAIPLYLWITTKLLLAPSAILLENATIREAIARSWRLTRGRFWPALGVTVIINLVFGVVAQVVAIPFSLLGTAFGQTLAPTGDSLTSVVASMLAPMLLTQAVGFVVQAVSTVVQSTASALIYIDCRMRHEGLDLDLLAYVEKRDAGAAPADPYTEHIGRSIGPRPGYGAPYPYPAPYGQAPYPYPYPYPAAPASAPPPVYAPPAAYAPPAYAPPAYAPPAYAPPAYPPQAHPAPPAYPAPPAPPSPTQWTAPGAPADDDPEVARG